MTAVFQELFGIKNDEYKNYPMARADQLVTLLVIKIYLQDF